MEKFVKIPIFPLTKYMNAGERKQLPAPMKPISFYYGDDEVYVDTVLDCDRGVSRKVGGRGFYFRCKVSWYANGTHRTKESVLWYDDFLQEWFVEVPETKTPANWYEAKRLKDVQNFLDNY